MTFATTEHAEIMSSILTCWTSFVGQELSAAESQHVYSLARTSSSPLTYTEDFVEANAADRWRFAAFTATNATSPRTPTAAHVLANATVGQSNAGRLRQVRKLQEE